jgi:hypothetical protein
MNTQPQRRRWNDVLAGHQECVVFTLSTPGGVDVDVPSDGNSEGWLLVVLYLRPTRE